jgi:hypothetical protein
LETFDERVHGLNQIVAHYSGQHGEFDEKSLANLRVWEIAVETLSSKQSKDKAGSIPAPAWRLRDREE